MFHKDLLQQQVQQKLSEHDSKLFQKYPYSTAEPEKDIICYITAKRDKVPAQRESTSGESNGMPSNMKVSAKP